MTILFPDVSRYNPTVDPARYPVIIAKATMADGTHGNIDEADPTYTTYKAEAAAAGTYFIAYHWINHGNLRAQAAWCFQHVGPDVPLMIDAEDEPGNTGYSGPLTIDDLLGFKAEYLARGGGPVNLGYLPFWYWSGAMSAPHTLDRLTAAGINIVSSNYPNAGYTDNGPGWAPYYAGAPAPVQWQYADVPFDMNAYRGTLDDYITMTGGDMALTDDDVKRVARNTARLILSGAYDEWGFNGLSDQVGVELTERAVNPGTGPHVPPNGKLYAMLNAITSRVQTLGGLSEDDRTLLQSIVDSNTALKMSVDALNSRLSTP